MLENNELRRKARKQLQGNWGKPILACFLTFVILAIIAAIPVAGHLAQLLVAGPFMIGLIMYFLRFQRGQATTVEVIFEGFTNYIETLGIYWWVGSWVMLWSLLLVIPGIIKSLSYSMAYYLVADNPTVGIRNALNTSKKITYGYKVKIFLLNLSFIGWGILSVLSLGIGFLWLIPYMQLTSVNLYLELKDASIANGICTSQEF